MLSTTQPAVTRLTLVICYDMQIFQIFLYIGYILRILYILHMLHSPPPSQGSPSQADLDHVMMTTMVVMGMIMIAEMTEMMMTN